MLSEFFLSLKRVRGKGARPCRAWGKAEIPVIVFHLVWGFGVTSGKSFRLAPATREGLR